MSKTPALAGRVAMQVKEDALILTTSQKMYLLRTSKYNPFLGICAFFRASETFCFVV